MVTVLEEKPGYDWNSFLSDIGGSLGFFLGLSVVGALGVLENFYKFVCRSSKSKQKEEEKQKMDEPPAYVVDYNINPYI